MRSKLSAMTALTPSNLVPLAAQSREEPVPYSLPAMTTSGTLFGLVLHRRVVNRHRFAIGEMLGVAAFGAAHQFVLDADIGEGAAHHHFMVAAPRAVGIEFFRRHAVFDQIFPGRAALLNVACGRNMIGGDRIAEQRQQFRAMHVVHRRRRRLHVSEYRRQFDVGRFRLPICRSCLRRW